jgi:hypothetical protein
MLSTENPNIISNSLLFLICNSDSNISVSLSRRGELLSFTIVITAVTRTLPGEMPAMLMLQRGRLQFKNTLKCPSSLSRSSFVNDSTSTSNLMVISRKVALTFSILSPICNGWKG